MVTVGKNKSAKIVDYGTKEINGNPVVEVVFEITGEGRSTWTGFFDGSKTEQLEYALKALNTMGLPADKLEEISEGPSSGCLNMNQEYVVEVQQQTKNGAPVLDKNGNPYLKVAWVNLPRTSRFDRTSAQGTKAKLSQFKGKMAQVQAQNPIKPASNDGW